jgi:hypothetical protein
MPDISPPPFEFPSSTTALEPGGAVDFLWSVACAHLDLAPAGGGAMIVEAADPFSEDWPF